LRCAQRPSSGVAVEVLPTGPKSVALYEQLRGAVSGGELLPGSPLSEVDLCRRYDVSRTPIREALVRLEQDGLVERRGSALFVRDRSADEIIDIYRVRIYLEGAIAFDAAHRRSETDLMRLDAAVAEGGELTGTDEPGLLQASNLRFHRALATACHNQTLQDLQDRLTAQVAKLPSTTLAYPGRWKASIDEHLHLVDAIRKQDGELARTVGSSHMQSAAEIRYQLIARELHGKPAGG
jgi:DNA-binding GntR family transcriptional regulator